MKKLLILLGFSFGLIACSSQPERYTSSDITAIELQQHIKYLASDELKGRKSGEEGNTTAAHYIADEFKSYGVEPRGDHGDYFQYFKVTSAISAGKHNRLNVTVGSTRMQLTPDEDFRPMANSSDTSISAGLAFVGYGIKADSLQYDDYANIDVHGKIVMMLRFTPDIGSKDSRFHGYESPYLKAFTARDKGAIGIIMVTGPADEEKPGLVTLRLEGQATASGIPIVNLKSSMADSLLRSADVGNDLKTIQQKIYDTKRPMSFEVAHTTVMMQTEIVKQYATTANVLGFLEGSDPVLKNQTVIIGAHFDHLGMGGQGSGSLKPDTVAIHHGADDNASGTAGVLELAQYFSAHRQAFKRSLLFTSFSGEEMGLLGSNYYVQHPTVPLESTIAMINMDMIGRLKDSTLIVEGMGTSPQWEPIAKKENADSSLKLKLKPDGYGPSDHASFYAKNLPVMFFFTNLHEDYHKPSDTWDKINYPGEQKVVEYVARIASDIADMAEKPTFTRMAAPAAQGDRRGAQVSLGVIPDFAEDAAGLKISGTRPGSPAEKAGLKEGDVIIKFGGKDVKNIYDFMYSLESFKPKDEVTIVVKRGTQEVTLKAILEARKQ
jgi:hypothetical protein